MIRPRHGSGHLSRRALHWAAPRRLRLALIGVERERIAELCRGKLDRFSLERLIRLLVRAGARIDLQIAPPTAGPFAQRGR